MTTHDVPQEILLEQYRTPHKPDRSPKPNMAPLISEIYFGKLKAAFTM